MLRSLLVLLATLLTVQAWALRPQEPIGNFQLTDHLGASRALHDFSDAKAIVFMVQGNGCPIVRNALPRFRELRDAYSAQGVEFLMINSNLQDNRISIAREAQEFAFDVPVLVDESQNVGERLGLIRTGEVFVVDPKTWQIAYHGAMDDRLSYENQKAVADHHYLKDALDDLVNGRRVRLSSTDAVGCLIYFPDRGR